MRVRSAVAILCIAAVLLASAPAARAADDEEDPDPTMDRIPFEADVERDRRDRGYLGLEVRYDEDDHKWAERRLLRADAHLFRLDPFAPQAMHVSVRWFDADDRERNPVKPEHFLDVRRIEVHGAFETDGSPKPDGNGDDQTFALSTTLLPR